MRVCACLPVTVGVRNGVCVADACGHSVRTRGNCIRVHSRTCVGIWQYFQTRKRLAQKRNFVK